MGGFGLFCWVSFRSQPFGEGGEAADIGKEERAFQLFAGNATGRGIAFEGFDEGARQVRGKLVDEGVQVVQGIEQQAPAGGFCLELRPEGGGEITR